MTPLFASALLLLAPTAQAAGGGGGVFKDVCDKSVRAAADDVACVCAKKATAAESRAALTGADPDYSSWWGGFTFDGGTRSVNGVDTGAGSVTGRANDSCFDLIDHANAAGLGVRNGYLDALEGFAATGAALNEYRFEMATSDGDGDGYHDWVDSFGMFGHETSLLHPAPRFPPIILDPLDPLTTKLSTEEMGESGTVQTGGREIAGGFLQEVTGNGELDAVIFLEDGGNFVLEDVGPHKMYTLPPQ